MKFKGFSKKIVALLLIIATLLLACACGGSNADDKTEQDGQDQDTAAPAETDALLDTDILISGDKAFRIAYADGYKAQAIKIQDKIIGLDKSYAVGAGKYATVKASTAADGTPEIIIGDSDRPATAEAKKLVEGKENAFAIYVTSNAIAIYSATEEGVENAVSAIIKNFRARGNSVVYDNSKGNFTEEFESTAIDNITDLNATTLLNALRKVATNQNLPVFSIAVSDKNEVKSSTVKAGNPCQNCYSVTKVYCVTAIGMLYDEGKIKTTDTIGEIFKDEIAQYGIDEAKWADITIHDVMRHEVGFKVGGLLDIDAQDATKWESQDYLKLVLEAELDGKKSDRYTDAAYYLISRVVSKISGENLDTFLATRLFNKTNCREYAFASCPMGYPMGATGLYIRSEDVAKLGRIYLNKGTYNGTRIISEEWVNMVIENGYELGKSGTGYAKGGMRGQYLYINYKHDIAVAWHSYDPDDTTWPLGDAIKEYMK